jgi:hypothetical protein
MIAQALLINFSMLLGTMCTEEEIKREFPELSGNLLKSILKEIKRQKNGN